MRTYQFTNIGVDDSNFEAMAERAIARGGMYVPLPRKTS